MLSHEELEMNVTEIDQPWKSKYWCIQSLNKTNKPSFLLLFTLEQSLVPLNCIKFNSSTFLVHECKPTFQAASKLQGSHNKC